MSSKKIHSTRILVEDDIWERLVEEKKNGRPYAYVVRQALHQYFDLPTEQEVKNATDR